MSLPSPFLILDLTGTAAFAVSGAMTGMRKGMDIFGILILALITATGGGIIRDLLLGGLPPTALTAPIYFSTALVSGFLVFLFYKPLQGRPLRPLLFFDAIGLAIFTITGLQTALALDLSPLALLFMGTLTGIGGGILRDILSSEIPLVFQRELYASVSLTGGVLYLLLLPRIPPAPAGGGVIIFIVAFRLISLHFNWHLPTRFGRESP